MVESKSIGDSTINNTKESVVILKKLEVGSFAANCYIIGDEITKEGMIIDPGDEADLILKNVKALGIKIKTIVLTHAHIDHINALAEVKQATNAEIAIHEDEAPSLQRQPFRLSITPLSNPVPKPDRLLKDGDTITIGKLSFKVIHTPGHTQGGISLLGDGIVFTGDTLFYFGIGRTDFPGGNYDQELGSIRERLMTLKDNTVVYSGHGPDSTIGTERRGNPFLHDTL
jgi:hydroxyacylglutathione hydrolase